MSSATIKAAGDPDRIADLGAVRERFDEAKWIHWYPGKRAGQGGGFPTLTDCLRKAGRPA